MIILTHLFLGIVRLIARLPIGLRSWLGSILGLVASWIPTRDRLIARLQLQKFLGSDQPGPIVRKMYRSLGSSVFESLNLEPILSKLERHVDFDGWAPIRASAAKGNGLIFLTGHVGNWDLLGAYCVRGGMPLTTAGRVIRNPALHEFVKELRERYKINTVWRSDRAGLKAMIAELQGGGTMAALIDQDTRVTSVFSKFFGAPVRSPSALVELGKKLNCAFYSTFLVRTGFLRFRISSRQIDSNLSTDEILGSYNKHLEDVLREHPDQWVWLHKRWRTKADGTRMSSREYLEFLEKKA